MILQPTELPGLFRVEIQPAADARGLFVKTFLEEEFRRLGLATQFEEEYYSVSHAGVLRGLHFQTPPHDHDKIVYCVAGRVLDAVVDLRVGSPTHGRHALFPLQADTPELLYIPKGLAHGFYVEEGPAILCYKVTSPYCREADGGIRWDSAGISWPNETPILSERDRGLPALETYTSPFVYRSLPPGGDGQ